MVKRWLVDLSLSYKKIQYTDELFTRCNFQESLMSRIVHPKLIYLKNLVLRSFSEVEGINDEFRIVIFCSVWI